MSIRNSTRNRRGPGRAAREKRRAEAAASVKPLVNKLPLTEILDEAGLETIHRATVRLLKEVGILIIDYPSALDTFAEHGARVKGQTVFLDEDILMHFIRQVPNEFTWQARNPDRNLRIGGRNCVFAPMYGPPFVLDYERGRRQATLEDFHNFAKLSYLAPDIHSAGGTLVEPNDIDISIRHLDMLMAHIQLNDKAFLGSITHANNARDTVAMAEILFGAQSIRENPAVMAIINASSPMRFDDRMLSAVEVYAKAGQPSVITPFIIAGAMSPTTIAATLAQQNAEALFGICFAQMIRPGCPAIYGSFLTNIDMKTGAPCFGTPSSTLALYAGAQLARRYGIPFRSGGNFTASRVPDAQAGYESASTIWPTIQAGTNFVLHAAGWLEGGLIAGYEKFVIDLEMLSMMARYVQGISLNEEDFAWDAYAEAGPGNHFLGTQHTMRHYDTAFHNHTIFNMDNYEKWEEDGQVTTFQKAHGTWQNMLKHYEKPALDQGLEDQLLAFVSKRKREIRGD
jgi:trimethylamine--corrinoid protein Co-methyltransferase